MATVTVEVPERAFASLRRSPDEFAREMRIAAAMHWYHQELISQGRAAEIAGPVGRIFSTRYFGRRCPRARLQSRS